MKEQTDLSPEITVGEIVAMNYNAAGVFRQYGLNFCCGGGISLKEACEKGNVYLDDVLIQLKQLERSGTGINENFLAWDIPYLIAHIEETHHRFVRQKIEEISAYAQKVAGVHGERHPENIDIDRTFNELAIEMMDHMQAEENTVFPLIETIAAKRKKGEPVSEEEILKLKKELAEMEDDHDGAGNLMKKLRELSHNFTPPADACATYQILYKNLEGFEKDLHKHVHLENNILFKKAEDLLPVN
ncbi:MAG: iron-sulfur cluster repair di-iron protein [Balneolaceae bacterium]|nr:iron-sulfur cluster repair di-iron protein [Balneolaceae bacterium]